MSCYIRHIKDFLSEIGIEPQNKEERKAVDLSIREAIGKKSSDKCNEVWKEVKAVLQDDNKKRLLISDLRQLK
ncbi:MAG: hypothetical protein QME14_01885 [Methanobacteriaceae archaeon]|nr:hypothetical protein [Methanobacteriaceae archaeon]